MVISDARYRLGSKARKVRIDADDRVRVTPRYAREAARAIVRSYVSGVVFTHLNSKKAPCEGACVHMLTNLI